MSNVTVEGVKRKYGIQFDADAKKLIDDFMIDDPLTALAAVMREHGIGILAQNEKGDWASDEDIVIVVDDNGGMLSKILVLESKASLFADDIKPEQ